MPTTAVDLIVITFQALTADEQEEAYTRLVANRLERLAGEAGETARMLATMQRVGAQAGRELTPDVYRAARRELQAEGESVADLSAVIRYFGSWRQAKEALELSAVSTPLLIEARFRKRLVGKVHRYREATLGETLARCAAELGRPPLVVEFEHWREREHELAKARGEKLFLPSSSPYRRRFGTWERALLHFGFTPEAVAERLEPGRERSAVSRTQYRYRRA